MSVWVGGWVWVCVCVRVRACVCVCGWVGVGGCVREERHQTLQ